MRLLVSLLLSLTLIGSAHARINLAFVSHGAKFHAELVAPANPRAGVVLIHGSGPDGAADYRDQAQMFAAMGYAALTYDKRGWSSSGGDWRHRPAELLADDAVAAAKALRKQIGKPVGYWGISQGGWILAGAGARDPDAAFLIGLAAAGVTPLQQERWHKQQMMKAAGYPRWARRIADRFWTGALDLMTRLDRHPRFLAALLANERAASSFGLDYSPLPDWRRSRAPLLLLYGSADRLQPWFDSGPRIAAARPADAATVIRIFPGASHAATMKRVGLDFDWGEHWAPAYGATMRRFIDGALSGQIGAGAWDPVPDWADRPILSAPLTLAALIGLPSALLALLFFGRTAIARSLVVTGLMMWILLMALIVGSIFPVGSFFDPAARFPAWAWALPLLAVAALIAAVIAVVQSARKRETALVGLGGAATLIFVLYWI